MPFLSFIAVGAFFFAATFFLAGALLFALIFLALAFLLVLLFVVLLLVDLLLVDLFFAALLFFAISSPYSICLKTNLFAIQKILDTHSVVTFSRQEFLCNFLLKKNLIRISFERI